MLARAERHVGIEVDDLFARLFFIVDPFGHDDDAAEMDGAEVLLPHVDPVVALDLALGLFQRAEVDGAFRTLLARGDLPQDEPDLFLRFRRLQIALDEDVAVLRRDVFVHIVPEDGGILGKRGGVGGIADGDAVGGVRPHRVGDELAPLGGGMYGEFDVFHGFYYRGRRAQSQGLCARLIF